MKNTHSKVTTKFRSCLLLIDLFAPIIDRIILKLC